MCNPARMACMMRKIRSVSFANHRIFVAVETVGMANSSEWKRAPGKKDETRAERLAAELRANLKKRKAQARHRAISEVADAPKITNKEPNDSDQA